MGENVAQKSTNALVFNDLPDEDMIKIFSYLSLWDRKNARLVCVRWRNLSYELKLISNDLTEVENYIDLSLFGRHTRHVNIRVCKEPDPDADYRLVDEFWGRHGGDVKSLEFVCGPSTFKYLRTIFSKCRHLRHVTLNMVPTDNGDLNEIFDRKFYLPLASIKLRGDANVVFGILDIITGKTSRLEKLHLSSCDTALVTRPHGILQRILRNAPKLNTFLIEMKNVPDDLINLITEMAGVQFKRLQIRKSEDLTDRCLANLSKRTPNMKEFFLADGKFSEGGLLTAISNMEQLMVISFLRVANLTISVLSAMVSLNNLTHLELGWWDSEDEGEGLKIALGTTEKPLITELRLIACNITDDVIETIAPKLPNLKILNLTCSRNLSIGALRAIFRYNTRLECLSIAGCAKMDWLYFDADLSLENLRNLLHLDVSNIFFLAESFKQLNVPSLVALEYRPRPLGSTMEEISEAFPSLKYFNNARFNLQAGNREGMKNASFLACMKSPLGECIEAYTRYFPGFD